MTTKKPEKQDVIDCILTVIDSKKPETIDQLLKLVADEYTIDKDEIMNAILQLKKQNRLNFEGSPKQYSSKRWFFSSHAVWFYLVNIFAILSAALLLVVFEQDVSGEYLRAGIIAAFVLYVPGYSLAKALFAEKELGAIERVGLSIVLSVSLLLGVAFILNYTEWGIRVTPITISLLVATIAFSAVGLIRQYKAAVRKTSF